MPVAAYPAPVAAECRLLQGGYCALVSFLQLSLRLIFWGGEGEEEGRVQRLEGKLDENQAQLQYANKGIHLLVRSRLSLPAPQQGPPVFTFVLCVCTRARARRDRVDSVVRA